MNPALSAVPLAARPTARSPIDFETDLGPLPLHGTLPDRLVGALVRNGPNPVFPNPAEHWFVGDGMLYMHHAPEEHGGFCEVLLMIATMVAVQAEIVWRRVLKLRGGVSTG